MNIKKQLQELIEFLDSDSFDPIRAKGMAMCILSDLQSFREEIAPDVFDVFEDSEMRTSVLLGFITIMLKGLNSE